MARQNLMKNPETGEWIQADGRIKSGIKTGIKGNVKFKTAAEAAATTAARTTIAMPVQTKAQEFDISSWWTVDKRTHQATFNKEGYEIIKNSDGTTTIRSKPKTYTKYYKKKEKKKNKEYGTYIEHEMLFDKNGKIVQETRRDDYESYDKSTDNYRKQEREVYTKEIKKYNTDGGLTDRKEWDDYESDEDRYDDGRKTKRDVYLRREYDYTQGIVTKHSEPNTDVDDYRTSTIQKAYKLTDDQASEIKTIENYQDKLKKANEYYQQRGTDLYNKATTESQKASIAKTYNLKWTVNTPDGKTYTSSNKEWLNEQVDNYYANETTAQRNKRYLTYMNDAWNNKNGWTFDKVEQTILNENPELKAQENYNRLSSTKKGRETLVQQGFIDKLTNKAGEVVEATKEIKDYFIETGKLNKPVEQTPNIRS